MTQHRIFGIRHHGPGSARALVSAFDAWQPDCVLIEGPPEGDAILHWLNHDDMETPVAMLVYRPDAPAQSSLFPFAEFSPEYQALRYALKNGRKARFFDLPIAWKLATEPFKYRPGMMPLDQLATIAGSPNYERWWNSFVEQRRDFTDIFEGLLEMVTAARESVPDPIPPANGEPGNGYDPMSRRFDNMREAHMRRCIREAVADGYERIAVVCGAWHGPALVDLSEAESDEALLADLHLAEVEAAWIPWTYGRLSTLNGYGAGIHSPGWYHHLWETGGDGETPTEATVRWLTKVAGMLREEGIDASAAHVIETVRLAEALATIRNLPLPGLPELNEAVQTVMCNGAAEPMQLIQRRLVIGERIGAVPAGAPLVPLQRDLRNEQKRLKLRPNPDLSTLSLDLRNDTHLERSQLLHRLDLINIPWGKALRQRQQEGSFKEVWRLRWAPDFEIRVIEANLFGNTVVDAVVGFVKDSAEKATLKALTGMLDGLLLADLPEAIDYVMTRIEERAAISSDVPLMIDALPPLARILRYGNVRFSSMRDDDEADTGPRATVQRVVDGLITRICINLPSTVASIDDNAAGDMFEKFNTMQHVIGMLNHKEHRERWTKLLSTLADINQVHNLLRGRASRLLFEGKVDSAEKTHERMANALATVTSGNSTFEQLMQAAFWIEGFLRDSGLVILHDQLLWNLLDSWVLKLQDENFTGILPLLRRTFASFSDLERKELQEKARGRLNQQSGALETNFDYERADEALPAIARLLGLEIVD